MTVNPKRLPIKIGRLRPLMIATGFLQRWCWIEIAPNTLTVNMSWGFRVIVPLAAIHSVRKLEGRTPLSIGVHGWNGRWLVNGSREGLVIIEIDPPSQAQVLGFSVTLKKLTVSVEEPDEFVDALTAAASS